MRPAITAQQKTDKLSENTVYLQKFCEFYTSLIKKYYFILLSGSKAELATQSGYSIEIFSDQEDSAVFRQVSRNDVDPLFYPDFH
ncbi:hypothetical protein [Egbenema bharatensis]|uniref:hypothetical protein n=1 Tax=Egbenema bharatensis TaxID=3463334 RepID=UPI003A8490D1